MKPLLCLLLVLLADRSPLGRGPAEDPDPGDIVQIPAGEFWMGRTHNWLVDELGMHLRPRLDDQPAHLVYLDAYWIDKYEVTNQDYARFVQATGHRKPFHWIGGKVPSGQEKFPVYNVSWDDAAAYCRFAGKRLPTEAEWERAARGGIEKAMFPWGDGLGLSGRRGAEGSDSEAPSRSKRARYGFPNGPAPVGSYAPNGFGVSAVEYRRVPLRAVAVKTSSLATNYTN